MAANDPTAELTVQQALAQLVQFQIQNNQQNQLIQQQFHESQQQIQHLTLQMQQFMAAVHPPQNALMAADGRRPRQRRATLVRLNATARETSDPDETNEDEADEERPPRRGEQSNSSRFRPKLEMPSFSGNMSVEEFLDWICGVENDFDCLEVPDDMKVRLVACKLTSGASAWWSQIQISRMKKGKHSIKSWPQMKKMLTDRLVFTT